MLERDRGHRGIMFRKIQTETDEEIIENGERGGCQMPVKLGPVVRAP